MTQVSQYERPYYYNNQLRRYLVQFMALFGSFQVQVGHKDDIEPRLIPIHITNASKDRVVAWIKSNQTQNKMIRLPMFSVTLSNMRLSPEMRHGVGVKQRNTHMPTGGLYPDDITVVERRMPVPYTLSFELAIWASNQDQHYQIIEQITSLFDPVLTIQTSDDVLDHTRLTHVELTNIRFEENVPAALERRVIQTTLEFEVPVWMSIPSKVHSQFVETIFMRVGAVSQMAETSFDIVDELNELGIQYEQVIDVNDIDID